ncbi:MAG: EthD protein, partial [Gammaproteobacteria bacterium]|nr:EthD protein [Gammaproteobacteria bacterium]
MSKINTKNNELSSYEQQRRTILKGAGATLTMGTLAANFGALLPRGVHAADSVVGSRCLTILYQNGANVTFDFDYYRDKHLTMIMDLYGNSIKRFELRKPVAAEAMPPPAYVAVVNFWVND